ncbi:GAF domain-containing protein [Metabacillus elymi]|uniref:histidine kinase n=1 Tax=Metabacillus elymi TaxID=2745198 RepID=A0ABX6S2C1_9BACI|nr:GAF domain-containing protein [Metabacillus sp. KUDC1714]QNF28182.1 GAF domain-containing protein [Metabacillus sp. KUDC1714]
MLGVISIFNLEGIFKDGSSSFLEKEQRRLTELYSLNLIGTPEEKSFDQITNLASRLFGVPISLITLITEDKQWFKSCVGLPDNLKESRSTERSAAFCHCVVADGNPLVVQDSSLDERFINNRFVKEYNIRFYAGAPIITKNNNVLGSLCIIDTKPRLFSEEELNTLIDLSNWVKAEIELKADLIERTISEQSIRTLYEVTSNNELSFQDKLRNLLILGCKRFNFPNGVVSRIKNNQYEVLEAIGASADFLKQGDLIPLTDTCSSNVAASLEPVHIKDSYNQYTVNGFKIDEYIGAPIFVNKQFYGTFCFISGSHDVRTITYSDLEFLQLMAQWIGNELERLQSKTKLKESQERLQQIANNIKEAFWMFDIKEEKLLYMSSAWFDISGMTFEDFNQNPTLWLNAIHPDDLEYTVNRFKDIKESGEFDYRLFHANGTIRWIRNRIVPIFNKEGIISKIVGVAEDITDSKINEELLRKSDKLAAVGQLAASIAHEIRNPLTSIKGFMQLINNEQCSFKEILISEFNQIENFINEILMLANPHHETTYEKKPIDKLVQEVVNTIKGQANLHEIQFSLKMNDETITILCDGNQIKQAFQNIIENAVEAMPDGGLVSIEIGTELEQFVYVLVEDQGIGITKERLTKLGEPFYSNKEKGSGLGLMISYNIIQNHQGRIEFTSQLNKGTKVKVLLPIEC